MSPVEVAMRLTADADAATRGLDDVADSYDDLGRAAQDAGRRADDTVSRLDRTAGAADNLDDKAGRATGALGALSSGFELVGAEKYAGALQAAALATDFASGAGQALTLVTEATGLATLKAKAASTAAATASKVQAAAQWALNAAMSANPIALVVLAVIALIAIFVVAYKRSETFRNIVDGALRAIGAGGKWMWENALKPAFAKMMDGIRAVGRVGKWLWDNVFRPVFAFIVGGVAGILDMWARMLRVLGKVPGFGWAKTAADKMGAAADQARKIADGIRDIPDRKDVDIRYNYYQSGQVPTEAGPRPWERQALNGRTTSLTGDTAATAGGDTYNFDFGDATVVGDFDQLVALILAALARRDRRLSGAVVG